MFPQDYAASTQITHLWSKHKGHPGPLIWKAAAYNRLIIFIWKKKIYFNTVPFVTITYQKLGVSYPRRAQFSTSLSPQTTRWMQLEYGRSQKHDEDQLGSHVLVFVTHTSFHRCTWNLSRITPHDTILSYLLLHYPFASVVRGRKNSLPLRHPWTAALGTMVEGPSGFVRLKEQYEGKAVRGNFSFRIPWSIFTRAIMEFRNCSVGMIEKLERGKWHFKSSERHNNQLMIT